MGGSDSAERGAPRIADRVRVHDDMAPQRMRPARREHHQGDPAAATRHDHVRAVRYGVCTLSGSGFGGCVLGSVNPRQ